MLEWEKDLASVERARRQSDGRHGGVERIDQTNRDRVRARKPHGDLQGAALLNREQPAVAVIGERLPHVTGRGGESVVLSGRKTAEREDTRGVRTCREIAG